MEAENIFLKLSAIDCNKYVEKKDGLTYLSWAWAWGLVKSAYPTANYKVNYFDGRPYFFDKNLGYMVSTEVTINGETISMHLPVMDSKNKAMKDEPYSYKTKYGEKYVEAATMFDINTAIMRCLTKNLAMFGLGHYIYAGEDLPETTEISEPSVKKTANDDAKKEQNTADAEKKMKSDLDQAIKAIMLCKDNASVDEVMKTFKNLWTNTAFKNAIRDKRKELANAS